MTCLMQENIYLLIPNTERTDFTERGIAVVNINSVIHYAFYFSCNFVKEICIFDDHDKSM